MNYKLDSGKIVRIPDEELEKNMRILKISKDEAIQMYLEDEGYLENEEQEALTKKAKENRITATIHQAKSYTKKTQKERCQKEDLTKENIIKTIAEALRAFGATNIVIENKTKLISFQINDDKFKVDLIRTRPPKKGG